MKYLSLFSGIEAASQAWQPLGWQPVAFSEIEPFPCAVLAHHYPDIPNLGDVTAITQAQIAALGHIDVVVGGSPCQDFSLAGKRAGIAGKRSSLFHELVRIFHAAHTLCGARYLVWENVPGTLSVHQGRDFAVVAGTLAGCDLIVPDNGWGTEGVALGRNGLLEWAVLDAQWFGLAQRRKRLFAVLDTGRWADRPPILLERDSLRGDCPTRRQTGQNLACAPATRTDAAGAFRYVSFGEYADTQTASTLKARNNKDATDLIAQGNTSAYVAGANQNSGFIPDTSMCLTARGIGKHDAKQETFVVHGSLGPTTSTAENGDFSPDIAMCLNAKSTGRMDATVETFIVHGTQDPIASTTTAHALGTNHGQENVVCAFDYQNAELTTSKECTPTLCGFGGKGRLAVHHSMKGQDNAGHDQPIVTAFQERGRSDGTSLDIGGDVAYALTAPSGGGRTQERNIQVGTSVRRLTPRECERLQGFPDDYTLIPWRTYRAGISRNDNFAAMLAGLRANIASFFGRQGKISNQPDSGECPDGPRYKALGNSMAVPVMRWIGAQINAGTYANTDRQFIMEKAA